MNVLNADERTNLQAPAQTGIETSRMLSVGIAGLNLSDQNPTMNAPETITPSLATVLVESDVASFLLQKSIEFSENAGGLYCTVGVEVTNSASKYDPPKVQFTTYLAGDDIRRGESLEGLMNDAIAAISPAVRAASLRAKAADLLREAESITLVPA